MFRWFTKKDKLTSLEKEIEAVLEIMQYHQPESEEYCTMVTNLELLYKMQKSLEKENKWISVITTGITVVGSLIGIGWVLTYEKEDSITTKAMGLLIKGRV